MVGCEAPCSSMGREVMLDRDRRFYRLRGLDRDGGRAQEEHARQIYTESRPTPRLEAGK